MRLCSVYRIYRPRYIIHLSTKTGVEKTRKTDLYTKLSTLSPKKAENYGLNINVINRTDVFGNLSKNEKMPRKSRDGIDKSIVKTL